MRSGGSASRAVRPEKVAGDLGVPDSVKFDAQGYIISTQVHSGQVLRIDPRTGDRTVLAQLTPGLDNSTFVGKRLFVSNITGYVTEILEGGKTRDLVPDGLNWPLGLAMGEDGLLYVADGAFSYTLRPGTSVRSRACCSLRVTRDIPAAWSQQGRASSSSPPLTAPSHAIGPRKQKSEVLASGFDQLYGVAIAPRRGRDLSPSRARAACCRSMRAMSKYSPTGLSQPSGVAVGR